ncbi:MAG TPA: hypothetical protein VF832_14895 [Longimicrobiales bacterium]
MHEIERRFIARVCDAAALAASPSRRLEQGYLAAGEPAVRVRLDGGAWLLTVKSGRGLVRREVEVPLPAEAGAELLDMAPLRLAKVRHRLGRWEIDVFEEALAGLVLAEVELRAADEPTPPPPSAVMLLREVTDDGRFVNQALAGLDPPAAAALLRAAYE